MAVRIDFRGQMFFKLQSLATAIGVKADFTVVAGRVSSTQFEDSPSLPNLSDMQAKVLPQSAGTRMREEKDA